MLVALLLLQAVSGPPVPKEFRKPRVATPCPDNSPDRGDTGEIVVCARPVDQRLEPLPDPPRHAPEEAMTFRLPGGGTGNVHAIQTGLPGAVGRGMAVTLTVPLKKKKREEER